MDKKVKRAYDKAMEYYEKGKINRALDICEEILSEGLDNPSVLNFKGLLLYQKGCLNEAVTVWRINQDLNNNDIAKNYIKDVLADEKRIDLYRQAEQALKQLKVDKALELFKQCAESDFNYIKVNTGLAMCYQKKGDLYKAREHVDKALSVDQSAVTARIIEKELKENDVYLESEDSSKGLLIGITIIFIVLAIVLGGYIVISKYKDKTLVNNMIEETKNNETLKEGDKTDENKQVEVKENAGVSADNDKEATKEESQSSNFDGEKLKILIDNKDFYGIYEQLKSVNEQSIKNEDAEVYKQASSLIRNEGVSKFYEYGLWSFNQGNYSNAQISLNKAYTYCEGNSLKEHILFYRASSSFKLSDNTTALAQYEEYYKQYPRGVYTEEALYELALLNKPINKEKSKLYANALINNYQSSIYVNDNIVDIVKN